MAMQAGAECSERLGVAAFCAGEPFGMLIALTTEIGHTLPSEEGKVALDSCSHRPFTKIPKFLTMLLAIKNGGP